MPFNTLGTSASLMALTTGLIPRETNARYQPILDESTERSLACLYRALRDAVVIRKISFIFEMPSSSSKIILVLF